MITTELNDIIEQLKDVNSDTTHIEIKSCQGGFPKRLWETLSSFANTPNGGVMVLGVSETSSGIEVTGISDPAKMQKNLAEVCSQMVPPLRPLIETHRYQGKLLVTAEIPEISYREKPCYYSGSGLMSGSFVRVFDGDRQLTQYEVQGFLDGRGQPRYDIDPVPGTSKEDIDKELLDLFMEGVQARQSKTNAWDQADILRTYQVLTTDKGQEALTLAGLLCLGKNPQQFFPGLSVHVLVYPDAREGVTGPQGERLVDNVKIDGSIPHAIPEIMRIIKRNIQKRTVVRGLFREDVLEYPELFLREAIINALVHRDYSPLARGSAVQIKLFPDRIEVANPGGLFGPVTEDRIGEQGLQASRNSFLIKLLEDLPIPGDKFRLCENRGTGIPSMIEALRNAGMEPPQFIDSRNQFRVTSTNIALLNAETLAWLEQFSDIELSERQRFVLAYVKHRQRITNPEFCRLTHCDSRIAGRELSALVEHGLLIRHGIGRWTSYTVQPAPVAPTIAPKKRILRQDRSTEILIFVKQNQPVGRGTIAEGLKLKQATVSYWLRKLVQDGKIALTTESAKDPAVKYIITKR
jgi:ATP-dependent DNA helicase RecG